MAAAEIIKNKLYIGTFVESLEWKGPKICVRENVGVSHEQHDALHLPFLNEDWRTVDMERLNHIADVIHGMIQNGEAVMVSCLACAERSPLVAAWYLHKYSDMEFKVAYDFVVGKREGILRKDEWINLARSATQAGGMY